jgi:septum formation topological specificity factor MinE
MALLPGLAALSLKTTIKRTLKTLLAHRRRKYSWSSNKVDELPLERLKELKAEIAKNLDKYNLKSKVASKVYYLPVKT